MMGKGWLFAAAVVLALLGIASTVASSERWPHFQQDPSVAGSQRSSSDPQIVVLTDASVYIVGEPLGVTVVNPTANDILLLDGQSFCSVVDLQRFDGSQWLTVGMCPSSSVAAAPVSAGASLVAMVDPVAKVVRLDAPLVALPTVPTLTAVDLRTLPTATPVSGPRPEIPEGDVTPNAVRFAADDLAPGTYRVGVTLPFGPAGSGAQSTYSGPFTIVP